MLTEEWGLREGPTALLTEWLRTQTMENSTDYAITHTHAWLSALALVPGPSDLLSNNTVGFCFSLSTCLLVLSSFIALSL